MPPWFDDLLARFDRVAVCGPPRSGKTTLATLTTDRPVIATDVFRALPWGEVPQAVLARCEQAGPRFVVEGVQALRAIRAGLVVDVLVWLDEPLNELNEGQLRMEKGLRTILSTMDLSSFETVRCHGPITDHWTDRSLPGLWDPRG